MIMEGRTLDPVYDLSEDEDDFQTEPRPKKTKTDKIKKLKPGNDNPLEVSDPRSQTQAKTNTDTESYSLEEHVATPKSLDANVGTPNSSPSRKEHFDDSDDVESQPDDHSTHEEFLESSHEPKSAVGRIVSVAKDAANIAAMLDVGDTDSIYERVKQLRNRSNRTDIVTNEILENGIEGLKRIIERDVNSPTQAGKEDDIFEEIESIRSSVLDIYPRAPVNPNEIYPLLEKHLNRPDRVKLVTDMLIKNIVQSSMRVGPMCQSPLEEQESPEIVSEEEELVADLEQILKHYPKADPDYVFKLITKHISVENRRDKVLEILQQESNHIRKKPLEIIYDLELKNDPLFRETATLSALFPNRDKNEIYAYLEAHYHTRNRVQVVTEELLRLEQGSQDDAQRYEGSPDAYSALYNQRYNGKNQAVTNTLLPANAARQPKRNKNATMGAIKLDNSHHKQSSVLRDEHCQREVELLLAVFPDCDPNFLFDRLEAMENDPQRVQWLSEEMFASHSYPKLKDRIERERVEKRLQMLQDDNINIEHFLSMFPDPEKVFFDESRRVGGTYKAMSLVQLQREFQIGNRDFIEEKLKEHNGHYLPTKKDLANLLKHPENVIRQEPFRDLRGQFYEMLSSPLGDFFFMELLFAKHEKKILGYLHKQRNERAKRLKEAESNNELQQCPSCCQDNILGEDLRSCPLNHRFCKDCIRQAAEANMADARVRFACLDDGCNTEFSLSIFREALSVSQFSLLLRRMQEDEVRRAAIKDLVSCPFCSFATIISDPNDRVFKCLNPECFRESCRLCRESTHVPLHCDEVVKRGAVVDMKMFIESKMTEAMVRKCWRCQKRFFITEGCNKATCSCGATMCYTCRQPISSYAHFSQGRCGYYMDVMDLHLTEMRQAAIQAREQWEQDHPEDIGKKIDCDPTEMLCGKVIRRKKQKPPPSIKQRLLNLMPPVFRRQKPTSPPDDSEEDYEDTEVHPLDEYYSENTQEEVEENLTDTVDDAPDTEAHKVVTHQKVGQEEKT